MTKWRWSLCVGAGVLTVLSYFGFLYSYLGDHAHFISDDFDHLSEAFTMTAMEMALKPIDVHLAPLHKLCSWLFFHAFELNFHAALLGLLTCLAVAGFVLYLALGKLVGRSVAVVTVTLILLSPAWSAVIVWWSAALHRIPFALMVALCLFGYVSYRERPRGAMACLAIGSGILAFGFYSKAILIPVMLWAIEGVLIVKAKQWHKSALWVLVPSLVIAVVFVFYYTFAASDVLRPSFGLGVGGVTKIAALSVERVALSAIFVRHGAWAAHYWALILALGVAWVIWRRPAATPPMVGGLLVAFASGLIVAKGRGEWALFEPAVRYVADDLFLLAPFAALFLKESSEGARDVLRKYWAPALGGAFVYMAASAMVVSERVPKVFPNSLKANEYVENIKRSYAEVAITGAAVYVMDANFPEPLYGFLGSTRRISSAMECCFKQIVWVTDERALPVHGVLHHVSHDGVIAPGR